MAKKISMDPIIEALVTGASDDTIMEMLAEKEKGAEEHEEKEGKEEDQSPKYRSCIKVRGRPILLPVMTEEVRRECQEWKRRALEVEERLAQERRVNIMEKVDRIVTRAMAAGHKVDNEDQIDESLKLESGELSEEEEDESMLVNKMDNVEDGGEEESSSLQSVMRANSRLGEEVLTGRTEEETLTEKEKETLAQEEEVTDNESQGLSEGELTEEATEEISEELTEEISEDTDEEDIPEDILEERQIEVENEGQEHGEIYLDKSGIENAEPEEEQVKESAIEQYNTEVFQDSTTHQELSVVKHTEEIKPEKSEDKQISLLSRSQISESYSGPKSFEEIKKLVKSLPVTPSLPVPLENDKLLKDYEDDASSFISDDDDETCAPSITTEVYEEWRYNLVEDQQPELNQRPGITDSLLSVATVVENPIFGRKATIKEREEMNTAGAEANGKEDQEKEKLRPRRGSYSLDQPSPLLAAHMARFQSS